MSGEGSGKTRWDAMIDGSIPFPLNDTLGFAIGETPDPETEVVMTWEVPAELCNSAGNLQGGMLATFADSLLGASGAAHMPADQYPTLAEMKISIFRPAPAGTKLVGKGRVIKKGRRVLFAEADVFDDTGKLLARASGTEIPSTLFN